MALLQLTHSLAGHVQAQPYCLQPYHMHPYTLQLFLTLMLSKLRKLMYKLDPSHRFRSCLQLICTQHNNGTCSDALQQQLSAQPVDGSDSTEQ